MKRFFQVDPPSEDQPFHVVVRDGEEGEFDAWLARTRHPSKEVPEGAVPEAKCYAVHELRELAD